jgi:hypothetical protein
VHYMSREERSQSGDGSIPKVDCKLRNKEEEGLIE